MDVRLLAHLEAHGLNQNAFIGFHSLMISQLHRIFIFPVAIIDLNCHEKERNLLDSYRFFCVFVGNLLG